MSDRIIEVRMSEHAALELSRACTYARSHLSNDLSDRDDGEPHGSSGLTTGDWLGWGGRWLADPTNRVDYDKAMQDTIAAARRTRRLLERTIERLHDDVNTARIERDQLKDQLRLRVARP